MVRAGGVIRRCFRASKHVRWIVLVFGTEPRASRIESEVAGVAQLEEILKAGLFFMPYDTAFVAAIYEFFVFEPNPCITPIRSGEEKTWDERIFC